MIVPTRRLLILALFTLFPLSLWGSMAGSSLVYALVLSLAVLLVALADGVCAPWRLKKVSVELPKAVRLTRGTEGEVTATVSNGTGNAMRLKLGLVLPSGITPLKEALNVRVPADPASSVRFPCMPDARGRFTLNSLCIGRDSALGLWEFREERACASEIRVYPDLSPEHKKLASLFLNRGGYGIHWQRQVGKGREFEKLREYIPGDSYDEIHWKATAKRRKPITKVFQIERTQEIYMIVDTSRLSARVPGHAASSGEGPARTAEEGSILERYITSAIIMGLAALKQGDLFGLITFSDRVHDFIRAGAGMAHHGLCRDTLSTLQADLVNPDFDELCTFIRLKLRRRALLVLLTSLEDPVLAETLVRTLELVSSQHVVLVNMIRPGNARPLFSHADVSTEEDLHAEISGHMLWHHLRELERVLNRSRAHLCLLDHERMSVELVSQYLGVKQRQIL